jgi:hypothetical protein
MTNRFFVSLFALGGALLASRAALADNWAPSTAAEIRTTGTGTKVGIGITGTGAVTNRLDVKGGAAVGSYAGVNTAPTNGLLVSGNVGIGTTNPGGDKLSVTGNVKATGTVTADGGFKVKTWSMEVPDYVFDKGHRTMPLAQVEAYIKANKHLPEVPSAAALKAGGMDLAEMNLILLKKIEELTLHVIAQDKKLAELAAARKK